MLVYTGDIDGCRAKGSMSFGRPLERLRPKSPAFLSCHEEYYLPRYLIHTNYLSAFVPWNFVSFSDQTDPGPVTKGETSPPLHPYLRDAAATVCVCVRVRPFHFDFHFHSILYVCVCFRAAENQGPIPGSQGGPGRRGHGCLKRNI